MKTMRYTLLDPTWREIAQFDFAGDLLVPVEVPHDISDASTVSRVALSQLCKAVYQATQLDEARPLMLIRRKGVDAELEVRFGHSAISGRGYNQVDVAAVAPTLLVGWLNGQPAAAIKFDSTPHPDLVRQYQAMHDH